MDPPRAWSVSLGGSSGRRPELREVPIRLLICDVGTSNRLARRMEKSPCFRSTMHD